MKGVTVFIIAGIAAILYEGVKTAAAVKGLLVSLAGVSYNKHNSTLLKSELLIKLAIQNPNEQTVSFEKFTGTVKIKGQTLAAIMVNKIGQGVDLKTGSNSITFPVTVSHINLLGQLSSILSAFKGGTFSDALDIEGVFYAGGFQLPISQSVALNNATI